MSFQDIEAGRPFASRRNVNVVNANQNPTQAVASGIFQINTAVSTFQRLVNTLGTPKDTPDLRDKLWVHHFGFHFPGVIFSLLSCFTWTIDNCGSMNHIFWILFFNFVRRLKCGFGWNKRKLQPLESGATKLGRGSYVSNVKKSLAFV